MPRAPLREKPETGRRIPVAGRLGNAAVPLAVADILKSGINTVENLMVPKRLARNLSVAEPLAAFGLVSGMVFPVLMFPACILFGLTELLIPELARCSAAGSRQRICYLVRRSLRIALLYGLVFGLQREPETAGEERRARVDAGAAALRRVPQGLWPALMGLFVAVYLVFFALQGSYLFDGLRGLLPEAFTAAEYARRGFFELCGVMAVNFALLGAASLSARGGLRGSTPSLALSAALIGQTALFSVTAGAKLILYIQRFGFTPLRVRSAWLVLTLLAACLAALRHLLTGRDSVKLWLIFAAVTLAGTCMW